MNKTRIALLNKAISLAGSYRIAYPNTGFEPVQGETYLKFDFVPADDSPVTLGSTGEDELTGFYQVSIMAPAGSGDGDSIALLDTFRQGFKKGVNLQYEDRSVRITSATFNQGMNAGSRNDVSVDESIWYPTYITIYWAARLARN